MDNFFSIPNGYGSTMHCCTTGGGVSSIVKNQPDLQRAIVNWGSGKMSTIRNVSMTPETYFRFIAYMLKERLSSNSPGEVRLTDATNYKLSHNAAVILQDGVARLARNCPLHFRSSVYWIIDNDSYAHISIEREDCGLQIISYPWYYGKARDGLIHLINSYLSCSKNHMYIGDSTLSICRNLMGAGSIHNFLKDHGFESMGNYQNPNYEEKRTILIRNVSEDYYDFDNDEDDYDFDNDEDDY